MRISPFVAHKIALASYAAMEVLLEIPSNDLAVEAEAEAVVEEKLNFV